MEMSIKIPSESALPAAISHSSAILVITYRKSCMVPLVPRQDFETVV